MSTLSSTLPSGCTSLFSLVLKEFFTHSRILIKICCLNKERAALGMAVSREIVDSGREIFGFTGILISYRWDYLEGSISKGGIKTIGCDYGYCGGYHAQCFTCTNLII